MKHFAINDRETGCRSQLFTWVSEQAMREIYLRPFEAAVKEGGTLAAMSSFNYIGTTFQHHSFSKCLAAMADGKIAPELTITHTFPLDRYFEALDTNWSDPTPIKIIIEPNGHL